MRSNNPILKESAFTGEIATAQTMTIQGTVNKAGILLLCVVVGAAWTWGLSHSPEPEAALPWTFGGAIGGFAVALLTIFKKNWSPLTSPIYALLKGLFLGGITYFFEQKYPGIAMQAISLTFGVMAVMLLAYTFRIIKATPKFVLGVVIATGGICLVYLVNLIMVSFFHSQISVLSNGTPLAIGISIFIVIIAALNLIIDFDMIERAAQAGAPKYMEWYGAFGLMVGLIWLYLQVLRLLSNTRRR
ncbi:MAG TPA: Bax inhibitor-1/YccA family protein [Candidatus Dormibacteraeota bacterium]|nr:Bax inhibitor-1/YccA family protein [Candidatus Dormibacteraeota bacterium]